MANVEALINSSSAVYFEVEALRAEVRRDLVADLCGAVCVISGPEPRVLGDAVLYAEPFVGGSRSSLTQVILLFAQRISRRGCLRF